MRRCAAVWIRHAVGNRSGGVTAAHRSHIAGSEAGDAATGGDAELRGAIARFDIGRTSRTLRLNCEQFAISVARDADRHAWHVIGDEKRMLALTGLKGAIAGGLRLIGGRFHVEASAVGGGCAGVILQLLLEWIRFRCSDAARWGGGLIAGQSEEKQQNERNGGDLHEEIVNRERK